MTTGRTFKRRMFLRLREGLGKARTEFAPHGVPVTVPEAAGVDMRYLLKRGRPYEDSEAALIRAHIAPGTPVIELEWVSRDRFRLRAQCHRPGRAADRCRGGLGLFRC